MPERNQRCFVPQHDTEKGGRRCEIPHSSCRHSFNDAVPAGSPLPRGLPANFLPPLGIRPTLLYAGGMKLPVVNQPVSLVIKGKAHKVTCTDLFDGGYGYYFDAQFSKRTRLTFTAGQRCAIPELGERCLADFVSYPTGDSWTVRFLISK